MQTVDINTTDKTVDGTPPQETFRPLRYTETDRDTIRVALWSQLSTILGQYRMDIEQGLDVELILDPGTSDAEREALVADVVLSFPGVTGIAEGPTLELSDDGQILSISVTANTVEGLVGLVVSP